MSDDLINDLLQDPGPADDAPRLGAGARLRAARERLNLSLEDIAVQIKTAPRKLAALEAERWEELPERPYLRGLIRNYARVVQLDSGPLLSAADASLGSSRRPTDFNLTPTLHAPFPHRPAGAHESPVSRWMMIGVVVCAVVIGGLLLPGTAPVRQFMAMVQQRLHPDADKTLMAENAAPTVAEQAAAASAGKPLDSQSSPSTYSGSVPPPASLAPQLAQVPAANAAAVTSTASGRPASPASAPAISDPALTNTVGGLAASSSDPSALHMQFKDDSWVEVRQADGKLVSAQIFRSGTEQAIDASAPLQVVIGNAPAVNVSFRGKPIDLDPYTHARVAHLSIP